MTQGCGGFLLLLARAVAVVLAVGQVMMWLVC